MDSEFLNAYVKKLKDLNNDLIDKNLLLQTQIEIQGKLIADLKATVEKLTAEQQSQKTSSPDEF